MLLEVNTPSFCKDNCAECKPVLITEKQGDENVRYFICENQASCINAAVFARIEMENILKETQSEKENLPEKEEA